MPTGFHAHAHCQAAGSEALIELLGLLLVSQAFFAEIACVGVHVRNLLEARVIITTYNDHVRLLSPEPSWLALAPPTLLGSGSRHCYGIITLRTPCRAGSMSVNACLRQLDSRAINRDGFCRSASALERPI